MTAALYFLAGVVVAVLATRAWLPPSAPDNVGLRGWASRLLTGLRRGSVQDPRDEARRAFMAFGWTLALAYLCFALSFLPHLEVLRPVWTTAGCAALAYFYSVISWLFAKGHHPDEAAWRLPWLAWLVGAGGAALHAVIWDGGPHTSLPEYVVGLFALGLVGASLHRLHIARQTADLVVERTRISWLMGIVTLATLAALAEWWARQSSPVMDTTDIAFFDRGLVLQGAIPPISSLLAAFSGYLLYHAIIRRRMVALQELGARLVVLSASATVFLLAHALTWRLVAPTRFAAHAAFLYFLVSTLLLAIYGAASHPLHRWVSRRLNQRGQALEDATDVLERELPSLFRVDALTDALMSRLYGSGRFRTMSIYLFDRRLDGYSRRSSRGETRPLLGAVAARPFTEGFIAGRPWYTVEAQLQDDPEVAGLMEAMEADVAVPLRSGRATLGWITLRDELWSDGFSIDELRKIARVARLAALGLANVEDFQRMEEERRLAALGEMSAGLAHEIRNPLAGLKGAAQVLEGLEIPELGHEMLHVIIEEANRLDHVVTQFLDYARPSTLQRRPVDLDALAGRVLDLVHAAGAPAGIELRAELNAGPCRLTADPNRLSQVLLNLVHNALSAAASEVVVSTRCTSGTGGPARVEIVVRDDGPGIPEAIRDQIFTPFFTTRSDGTGLGLPISRRLVEAHGGELVVSTTDGTAFVVRLPPGEPLAPRQ